jgi:hypothetical protein
MDDVMNKMMRGKKKEIDWGISQQPEDLDFADDIYMLSHLIRCIYNYKTWKTGKTVRQKINCEKTHFPQGQRKRGSPKRTWRRMVEEENGKVGKMWKEVGALAQNRIRWR